jgi:hypothetical protein
VHGGDAVAEGVDAGDRGVRGEPDARPGRGVGVPPDDQTGAGVPVGRGVGGGHEAVGADVRTQPAGRVRTDHAAGDAQAVLEPDTGLELLGLPVAGEQEQIADAVEADVGAGAVPEVLEGPQAAAAQFDVERVGELGPYSADRFA